MAASLEVQLTSRPSRIDVFGGTEDGWASLLVTVGSTQLAAGSSVFLLDFTDLAVGDNLAVAAAGKGYPVAVQELPRDLAELGIIADLDATELAEVIAETMHTMNRTQFGADLRGHVVACRSGPRSRRCGKCSATPALSKTPRTAP